MLIVPYKRGIFRSLYDARNAVSIPSVYRPTIVIIASLLMLYGFALTATTKQVFVEILSDNPTVGRWQGDLTS